MLLTKPLSYSLNLHATNLTSLCILEALGGARDEIHHSDALTQDLRKKMRGPSVSVDEKSELQRKMQDVEAGKKAAQELIDDLAARGDALFTQVF